MTTVGIIGAGRVAAQHAAAFEHAGGELLKVYDSDRSRAEAFAAKHGVGVCSSVAELLISEIELVLVLSPANSHIAHARMAIAAGKHALVEKPVSWSAAEVQRLEAEAHTAGVLCIPGHNSIYVPEIERMGRNLGDGELGVPIALEISETYRMPETLASRYAGPLEEVLIHHLYTTLFLLGRPDEVMAMAASPIPDLPVQPQHLAVTAKWESTGTIAQLYQSWAADDHTATPRTHRVHVIGSNGAASFSRRSVVGALEEGGNPTTPIYQELFDRQAQHIIARQLGHGEPPLSSLADAGAAAAVMQAVQSSIRTGRSIRPDYTDHHKI